MTRYAGLPPIPERIRRLDELAANLWWSWQYSPRKVFRDLDYQLWRATAHNPVKMLWLVTRERLEQMSRDEEFLNDVRRCRRRARRRIRREEHVDVAAVSRHAEHDDRVLLGRVRAFISRCRFMRAASACSPAITARSRATSACRWSASASCTRRDTSTRRRRPKAGSSRCTSGSTGPTSPSNRR